MMKKIKLFILLMNISFLIFGQNNDLSSYNLQGKVKSMSDYSYEAVDKFGIIGKGKYDREFPFSRDYIVLFNLQGKIIEVVEYRGDKTKIDRKFLYKYDSNDNLVIIDRYFGSGRLYSKEKYKYNNNGKLTKISFFNSSGNLEALTNYKYDSKGNRIEEILERLRSPGENKPRTYKYNYDSSGNRIEETYHYSGNLGNKTIYKYDRDGNMIEETMYDYSNDKEKTYKFKYDKYGNKIEKIKVYSNESQDVLKKYEYEYDNKGNWIKRIMSKNDFPKILVERKIEYFN